MCQCSTISKFNIFLSLNTELYSFFLNTGIQLCTIYGEESFKVAIHAQSFENYQLDTASIKGGTY